MCHHVLSGLAGCHLVVHGIVLQLLNTQRWIGNDGADERDRADVSSFFDN